ncbi:MAG: polysaccharide biosynthesis C-terminal domain-containing protein [Clostridia bacterium]|nr:polysaccharide biosynthesis C-terminal domain-containing protein [Clostridia bacterium]
MKFKLWNYILPSVISMVLVGTYTNIDGLFIGNVTGDDGLAAINFAWPIVAFITSLGTGVGVGGSVLLNQLRGQGDIQGAERIKSTMLGVLAGVGVLFTLLFLFTYKPLLVLMGAKGQVLIYACEYSKIVSLGAFFQIMGSGLVALLRNEQKTYFSMVCCIVGLVVHIVLDAFLVQTYTLAGVGVSTVLSQAVIMVLCFLALKEKGKKFSFAFDFKNVLPILKASSSPLGINFVPSVVLLFTNYFAETAGGTAAVSAYAVMSYAVYTFDYVFQGICDGVQPIVSFCHGAGDKEQENRALKVSAIVSVVCALAFAALTPLLIYGMPKVFATSAQAEEMMKTGFIFYAFSYLFKAAVKYVGSYYYAIGKTARSNLLVYADPLFFTPLLLWALSSWMGLNGVWLAMTVSQVCVSALGAATFLLKNKKKDKENSPV